MNFLRRILVMMLFFFAGTSAAVVQVLQGNAPEDVLSVDSWWKFYADQPTQTSILVGAGLFAAIGLISSLQQIFGTDGREVIRELDKLSRDRDDRIQSGVERVGSDITAMRHIIEQAGLDKPSEKWRHFCRTRMEEAIEVRSFVLDEWIATINGILMIARSWGYRDLEMEIYERVSGRLLLGCGLDSDQEGPSPSAYAEPAIRYLQQALQLNVRLPYDVPIDGGWSRLKSPIHIDQVRKIRKSWPERKVHSYEGSIADFEELFPAQRFSLLIRLFMLARWIDNKLSSIQIMWETYQEIIAYTPPDSDLEKEVVEMCGGVASDLITFCGKIIYDAAIQSGSPAWISRDVYAKSGNVVDPAVSGPQISRSLDRIRVISDVSKRFTYVMWYSINFRRSTEFKRHFECLLDGMEREWRFPLDLKSSDDKVGELLLLHAYLFNDAKSATSAVKIFENYCNETGDQRLKALRTDCLEWAKSFLRFLRDRDRADHLKGGP